MGGLLYGVMSTLTAIREEVDEQSHIETLKGGFGSLCLKSWEKQSTCPLGGYLKDVSVIASLS